MEKTIELQTPETLVAEGLKKAISYKEYRDLVANHVLEGTNTGPVQNEGLAQYTVLNDARMRRLDKTVKVPESALELFKNTAEPLEWLVITESWCGDAAQTMPVMNAVAQLSDKINFSVVLRDENPDLMNAFLTNGAMSIPKLVVFDKTSNSIQGVWGPRPEKATKMVTEFKEAHGLLTPEFKQELQVWYNKDKGQSTIEDLTKYIS
ncbi:thioredoxin family protein [Ulvibacter litoralis]|uniref:Thioredoxin n=1 Tax=Ulvibacter litoralis TaxID=227084 RepID=A0A1G7CUH3_9FLAO|nr:thioredoxin family protein [Ulvibacter litoralis]SDE42306.1 Thioredoxin [Ulvibacter litoralis]